MTRNLTASVVTELNADAVRIGYLLELNFDSSTVRLSNTFRDISWGGNTWYGNGWFHGADSIVEDEDLDVDELTIYLSGVNPTLLSACLSDVSADNTGKLYLVFFDDDWSVVSDPYLLFIGYVDGIEVSEEADDTNIQMSFQSTLSVMDKASNIRWTHNYQQTRFAADNGFNYIQSLEDWEGYWGSKKGDKKTDNDAKNKVGKKKDKKKKKKGKKKKNIDNKMKQKPNKKNKKGGKKKKIGKKKKHK